MPASARALPPPIREGDRLNSPEFLRRWEAMPLLKKAELIRGVVFMPSPVLRPHATIHFSICGWLWLYNEATPGCESCLDGTWVIGPGDVPQPDLTLCILPECGGQSRVEGDYAAGAPELIVEISGSSVSRDLGVKLDLYRRAGVGEYLTVSLKPCEVLWRHFSLSRYREIAPDGDGFLRSRVFPGLWLDPSALWIPKRPLRAAVEEGIRSPEHAAFVRRLAAKKQLPR